MAAQRPPISASVVFVFTGLRKVSFKNDILRSQPLLLSKHTITSEDAPTIDWELASTIYWSQSSTTQTHLYCLYFDRPQPSRDQTMGVFYEVIPPSLNKWIMEQKCFWVASAPLSGKGHINVSPKGGPYFGLIDEKTFWYQDLTGSGNETISHLHEPGNGRIVIMFNAFIGPPKIVRLWGYGELNCSLLFRRAMNGGESW